MIIVLDSNEYINYLEKKSEILGEIFSNEGVTIYINEIIVKEVLRNIDELKKKEFYSLLSRRTFIAYNEKLQFDLIQKYKEFGLKKGDIVISAFCESINADYLITENRHFLKSKKFDRFKVLSLKEFLRKIS